MAKAQSGPPPATRVRLGSDAAAWPANGSATSRRLECGYAWIACPAPPGTARGAAGHNSGMGEIFRKVAAISRVVENRAALPPRARAYEEPVAVPQQSRKKARGGDRDEL